MPIYEYHCEHCGQSTEFIQKVADAPETICPACNNPTLKKLISRTSFQLKGSGWYVTDFRDKSKPAATTTTAPSSKTEEKKATPSTDKTDKTK